MRLLIPQSFISFIKKQAISNENEIYGWLIGYKKNKTLNILSLIECKKFEQQSLISAIPDAQEFQKVSTALPQGIGAVGIFHSHPAGDVFHSHIDDSTLKSLSRQFPSSVSIVTNGKEVGYYRLDKKGTNKDDLDVEFGIPQISPFILIKFQAEFQVIVEKKIIEQKEPEKALKMNLLNFLSNYLDENLNSLIFRYKNKKITLQEPVNRFFCSNLNDPPVILGVPDKNPTSHPNSIQIFLGEKPTNKSPEEPKNNYLHFSLPIHSKIPIFISNVNQKLKDIIQMIKTELISNTIIPKIYNSQVDFKENCFLLPRDKFIPYFGFYLKISIYNNALDRDSANLLLKLLEFVNSLLSMNLNRTLLDKCAEFVHAIRSLESEYRIKDDIHHKVNLLDRKLKLKEKKLKG
ncbi:MAG: Mov34/MPN/PAD-1 family protein [Promethearchaeia archaeon]